MLRAEPRHRHDEHGNEDEKQGNTQGESHREAPPGEAVELVELESEVEWNMDDDTNEDSPSNNNMCFREGFVDGQHIMKRGLSKKSKQLARREKYNESKVKVEQVTTAPGDGNIPLVISPGRVQRFNSSSNEMEPIVCASKKLQDVGSKKDNDEEKFKSMRCQEGLESSK